MKRFWILTLLILGCAFPGAAQNPLPVLDVPRAISKPRLDSSMNDPAWKNAAKIPAFGLSIGSDARDVALPTSAQLCMGR